MSLQPSERYSRGVGINAGVMGHPQLEPRIPQADCSKSTETHPDRKRCSILTVWGGDPPSEQVRIICI